MASTFFRIKKSHNFKKQSKSEIEALEESLSMRFSTLMKGDKKQKMIENLTSTQRISPSMFKFFPC